MSKAFAFRLGQRLNHPTLKGVQGIVAIPTASEVAGSAPSNADPAGAVYWLRWLNDAGSPMATWFGEAQLVAANQVPLAGEIGTGGMIQAATPVARVARSIKRAKRRAVRSARRKR